MVDERTFNHRAHSRRSVLTTAAQMRGGERASEERIRRCQQLANFSLWIARSGRGGPKFFGRLSLWIARSGRRVRILLRLRQRFAIYLLDFDYRPLELDRSAIRKVQPL